MRRTHRTQHMVGLMAVAYMFLCPHNSNGSCYGLNHGPQPFLKFIYWSSNPQYLNLWQFGDKAFKRNLSKNEGFPGGSDGKESPCNSGDPGSIPGSGRSPREGNGYPLQYSCLENPMDRGASGLKSMGSQRVRHSWATNTFTVQVKMGPPRWVLIQYDWCLYKKQRFRHTERRQEHMKREITMRRSRKWVPSATQRERSQEEPTLSICLYWTFRIQKFEKINFCCLNHHVYGIVLHCSGKHRHQDKQQRENHAQKSIKETQYKFPKVLS